MSAEPSSPRLVRFASFELDVRSRELRQGSTRVRLQDQPFEILRLMLERPGDLVTRDELRERLWPNGTFVDYEHSLNAAVKRLRAALGDDADNPRFVETLPRRGYRFIAPLDRSEPALRPEPPRLRLAVLPFQNLSDDPAQEYFSDGLTEEMIAQLGSRFRGRIGVLARWSSMMFKGTSLRAREVAEALGADYLLEGSLRREGDRVRITARLIEAAGETLLWSDTFDRTLGECKMVGPLSLQAEVSERIARSLALELLPQTRSSSPLVNGAAYQLYLKGRYFWNKPGDQGLDDAIQFLQQAVAVAPSFGAAHAALARVRVARVEYYCDAPRAALAEAQDHALRALSLDAHLAEAHLARADVTRMLQWNWRVAEAGYLEAVALNPSDEAAHRKYAMLLASLGRDTEAIREAERACELDPLCLVVNTNLAWVRYAAGDYARVIEACRHTIDMDADCAPAWRVLGAAYLQSGQHAAALEAFSTALARAPQDPVLLAWASHAYGVAGRASDAGALLDRVRALEACRYVPAYHLALAHVGLGDAEAALEALERALVERDPVIANLGVEPRFEPLKTHPRYTQLLGELVLER